MPSLHWSRDPAPQYNDNALKSLPLGRERWCTRKPRLCNLLLSPSQTSSGVNAAFQQCVSTQERTGRVLRIERSKENNRCFAKVCESTPLAPMSATLSLPGHLLTLIWPLRTLCWTQRSAVARCRTRPSPSRSTMPMAAVASLQRASRMLWNPKSAKTDCRPNISVAPLTTAASSDSPEDKAIVA